MSLIYHVLRFINYALPRGCNSTAPLTLYLSPPWIISCVLFKSYWCDFLISSSIRSFTYKIISLGVFISERVLLQTNYSSLSLQQNRQCKMKTSVQSTKIRIKTQTCVWRCIKFVPCKYITTWNPITIRIMLTVGRYFWMARKKGADLIFYANHRNVIHGFSLYFGNEIYRQSYLILNNR